MWDPRSREDGKYDEERGYSKNEQRQGSKTEGPGSGARALELPTIPDRSTLGIGNDLNHRRLQVVANCGYLRAPVAGSRPFLHLL